MKFLFLVYREGVRKNKQTNKQKKNKIIIIIIIKKQLIFAEYTQEVEILDPRSTYLPNIKLKRYQSVFREAFVPRTD